MESDVAGDPSDDLFQAKLAECLARLNAPSGGLSWSRINSEYGQYGITKQKVHKYKQGRAVGPTRRRGRPRALTERQEQLLKQYMVTCEQMGFAKSRQELAENVVKELVASQKTYPFKTSPTGELLSASRGWWDLFFKRNRDMLLKTASPLSRVRASACNPRAFMSVYDLLRGRMDVPQNIVMIDETSVPTEAKWAKRVVGARNGRPANVPAGSIDARHVTLVAACTAAGQLLPPAYICAGKQVMEVGSLLCAAMPQACEPRHD